MSGADWEIRKEVKRLRENNSPGAAQKLRRIWDEPALVLGLDPDTGGSRGATGVVIATTRKVLAVGAAVMPGKSYGLAATRIQRKLLGGLLRQAVKVGKLDRCAIEIPIDYGQRRYADPNDLLRLSLISGAAAGILDEFCDCVEWVEPYKWKGQREKGPDWRNSLSYFGWEFDPGSGGSKLPEFTIPKDVVMLSEIPKGALPEIADALGLAIYALHREAAT